MTVTISDTTISLSVTEAGVTVTPSASSAAVSVAPGMTQQRTGVLTVAASTWTGWADYWCDGVDDQVQIGAAATALGSVGGTIQLTPGVFNTARAGTVTSNGVTHPYCIRIPDTLGPIVLRGAGRDATTIKLTNTQLANTIPLLVRGASATVKRTAATTIEHLTIDGNKANQPSWNDFANLQIAYADHVTVRGCRITAGKIQGLQVYRDSQHARILDCMFDGSTNAQLRLESHDTHVLNCTFDATGAAGGCIEVMVNADIDNPSQDVIVAGCTMYRFLTGIVLSGTRRALITGNTLLNGTQGDATSQWTIDIYPYTTVGAYDTLDVLVSNNHIYNCRNGIRLRATGSKTVYRARIVGNVITEGYSGDPFGNVVLNTGILETNAVADLVNVVIADNQITGATTGVSTSSSTTVTRTNDVF